MKNTVKTIVFLVSCTWLCGCQSSKLTDLDSLFAQKPVINLPIQLSNIQSDDIGVPVYFASIDSFLIVSEMFNNNFIAVYNTNSGKLVNRFASKGQGPNEFLGVSGLYVLNDQLLIHSTMPNRMVYVNKGDLLKSDISYRTVGFKEGEDLARYLTIAPVSDGLFMGTAMFINHDKKEQFAIADGNGEFLREFDQYPLNEELKSVANYDLAYGFQGTIQPSHDGRHALYYGVLHGVLKFFRFDSDNPVKIKEYVAAYPKFTSQAIPNEQRYGVIVSNESIAGAVSVAVSDDAYYVLFSNQPRVYESNVIYVFDFSGEPVKTILLNEPVNSIVYSRKDNALWAYREMEEDPRIDFIKLD